jgi:hypothetical protein
MGSTKHEKSFVDFEKPYEMNVVGLRGIVYFGIGLLLLILITFGLMRIFYDVMEEDAKATKSSTNPMMKSEKERLPPEPRLQVAPGFGIESESGRVNLELSAPQAEYRELQRQSEELWRHGRKDPITGMVTVLPIEEAKKMVLESGLKARSGPDVDRLAVESKRSFSDASSGRMKSLTRR